MPIAITPPYQGLPPHTNHAGYTVPDVTLRDPKNRPMRVVTIGAGYSGIMLAYKIERELQNVKHVVYEKNGDIGGAWLENRYPNCACDVPSHSYVYNFALNPHWPEMFSKADHIWKYLDRVCRAFDLRKFMKFNHKVIEAIWNEERGKWELTVEKIYLDGSVDVFRDECDVLLQAAGLLNNPVTPNIEGIETFKGKIVHTADWPDNYGPEQWKGSRIAVIGGGASSIQTTPGLQPHADHLDVFIRSPNWLASPFQGERKGDATSRTVYSEEEKELYSKDLNALVNKARETEVPVNGMWRGMFKAEKISTDMKNACKKTMESILSEPRLAQGLIPEFGFGCRRSSPGVSFMEALKQPNVDAHFTSVVRITPDGPVGADGTTTKVDTIVCATGFDTSYRPAFKLVGQNGISLAEKFTPEPNGYLGVSAPGMPNYLMFFGPSWPIFNGSTTASLTAVADLSIKMIRKIQAEDIRSIAPRQDVTDQFNDHVQAMLRGTVWEDTCAGWYHDKTGRVTAVWPGSALHFQAMVREARWEDYEIKYMNKKNMFAFMGLGFTVNERDEKADKAPYMHLEFLDKDFYDWERVPDYEGPAPTKESARLATAEKRSWGLNCNAVNGNGIHGKVADLVGFADHEVGHVKGFDSSLNYQKEVPAVQD